MVDYGYLRIFLNRSMVNYGSLWKLTDIYE
jgi:hypothetical protein